jgi:hypothetical protein
MIIQRETLQYLALGLHLQWKCRISIRSFLHFSKLNLKSFSYIKKNYNLLSKNNPCNLTNINKAAYIETGYLKNCI